MIDDFLERGLTESDAVSYVEEDIPEFNECSVCLGEHDEEIHAATVSVRGWFRDEVTKSFRIVPEVFVQPVGQELSSWRGFSQMRYTSAPAPTVANAESEARGRVVTP